MSDTGILGEKKLLSAHNRSQIYDLRTSILRALPQWVVGDLWQARLSTWSMMTNFLHTARIKMLFRVPWNNQPGLIITHPALTKLPWPKVLLKSYLGQKFYSKVTLAKSFTQKLPWLKVLLKGICRILIVIQILNNYYTKWKPLISDICYRKK